MNDQGLDKLFKDRLEGIEENPPVAAWDRLDAQLQGRKQKAWWQFARVAAVLVLIACSVILFNKGYLKQQQDTQVGQEIEATDNTPDEQQNELQSQPSEESLIADNADSNKGNASNKSRESTSDSDRNERTSTDSSDEQPGRNEVNTRSNDPQESPVKKEAPSKNSPQEATEKPANQIKLMQSPQTQVLAEDKSGQSSENPALNGVAQLEEQEQDINQQSEEQTSMDLAKPRTVKITYKKSPSPPEPTLALVDEPQEKTSAVKRLWMKAQNLKNGQVGLAKIRSAKDQLLVIGKKKKEKEVKSN